MKNIFLYLTAIVLKLFEYLTKTKTNYIHYAINFYLEKKNPLIVEVGCHNGEDTIHFSKTYPNGVIYAFEPDPRLTEFLYQRFKTNNNIKFYPKAVYKKNQMLNFNLADKKDSTKFKSTGSSSILNYTSKSTRKFYESVKIDAIRLDKFDELKNSNIDILWIDVQGAEKLIVESHEKIFRDCKIIWIEYGEEDYTEYFTRSEIIKKFKLTHSESFFSNRSQKGNLLLVQN